MFAGTSVIPFEASHESIPLRFLSAVKRTSDKFEEASPDQEYFDAFGFPSAEQERLNTLFSITLPLPEMFSVNLLSIEILTVIIFGGSETHNNRTQC